MPALERAAASSRKQSGQPEPDNVRWYTTVVHSVAHLAAPDDLARGGTRDVVGPQRVAGRMPLPGKPPFGEPALEVSQRRHVLEARESAQCCKAIY